MGRQGRWFWGILLTAFLVTMGLGIYPLINPSFSQALSTQASSLGTQAIVTPLGGEVAQAQAPEAGESAVFVDPAGQYEIRLLEGYQTYGIANTTVIEAADGNLAYTALVVPTFDPGVQLTDAALAQMARETFQQGEGFITKEFQPTQSGIKVNWQGRVTTRGSQRLSGSIFARQEGDQVLLLLLAATDAGQDALVEAIATLPASLKLTTP